MAKGLPRKARKETKCPESDVKKHLGLWAQPSCPQGLRHRGLEAGLRRSAVTQLLGSHQLLNHAQLLRAELGQDLGR